MPSFRMSEVVVGLFAVGWVACGSVGGFLVSLFFFPGVSGPLLWVVRRNSHCTVSGILFRLSATPPANPFVAPSVCDFL